jgi:hypothetical protein
LTEAYRTDAFRVPTHMQGTSGQPFQFAGQQHDATALYDAPAWPDDPTTKQQRVGGRSVTGATG